MRMESHNREVERRIRDGLKDDRAKTKVLKMSQFGIIELTRQRMRASREKSLHSDCPCCKGIGRVKTPESISLDIMRLIQLALYQANVNLLEVTISPEVFEYLHNRRNRELLQLEEDTKKIVRLHVGKDLSGDAVEVKCFDVHNHEIPVEIVTHVPAVKAPVASRTAARPAATVKPQPLPPREDRPDQGHPQEQDRGQERGPGQGRSRGRSRGRGRGRGRGRSQSQNRNPDVKPQGPDDQNQIQNQNHPEDRDDRDQREDNYENENENDTLMIEDTTPLDDE
jgi:ribonuclease E